MAVKITADPATYTMTGAKGVTVSTETGSADALVEIGTYVSPVATAVTNPRTGIPGWEKLPDTPATPEIRWITVNATLAAGVDGDVIPPEVTCHMVRVSGHGEDKAVFFAETV